MALEADALEIWHHTSLFAEMHDSQSVFAQFWFTLAKVPVTYLLMFSYLVLLMLCCLYMKNYQSTRFCFMFLIKHLFT